MKSNPREVDRVLKLCRVVTVPITFATLLRRQVGVMADSKLDVTLVSSPGEELEQICEQESVRGCPIGMSRGFTPLQDIKSLIQLVRLFRSEKFEVVHSSTPKAGLLTAIAGLLARIPVRMHTYTGQPWVTLRGWRRYVARWGDILIGFLDTHCYADSNSQREFLIREGVVRSPRISVLASGSISGVDLSRFDPEIWGGAEAAATRRKLGIPEDGLVVLFVGRLTRDKGIVELISAFTLLDSSHGRVDLVIVGPIERLRDALPQATLDQLSNHPRIHTVGFTQEPERYMGIADIFCLPSYREGFGSVVIEAAAMGVPAVVTSVVGLVDAVEPGETGLMVAPRDHQALRHGLSELISNPELRMRLGKAARARARRLFDAVVVDRAVANEYRDVYSRCVRDRHAARTAGA